MTPIRVLAISISYAVLGVFRRGGIVGDDYASASPVWLWDAPTALRLFMLWLIPAVLAAGQDHSCRSACRGAKLVPTTITPDSE